MVVVQVFGLFGVVTLGDADGDDLTARCDAVLVGGEAALGDLFKVRA